MRGNKSCPLYSQLRPQKRIFALRHVRFTPKSGHSQRKNRCPLRVKSGHQTTLPVFATDRRLLWREYFCESLALSRDDYHLGFAGELMWIETIQELVQRTADVICDLRRHP